MELFYYTFFKKIKNLIVNISFIMVKLLIVFVCFILIGFFQSNDSVEDFFINVKSYVLNIGFINCILFFFLLLILIFLSLKKNKK